ncbi:MAG: thioredoxin [Pseudomonadota bacterium]
MSALLNPWQDARLIATRLAVPGARLVLVLGAEEWCSKCSAFKPHFDACAATALDNETWLWLDLEEHAEFLGDFIPDNLPLLLAYSGSLLTHTLIPDDLSGPALMDLLAQPSRIEHTPAPDVRSRLLTVDWAG